MSVIISKTSEEEIKDFEDKAWQEEDIRHFGRPIDWVKEKFYFKAVEDDEIVGAIKGKFEVGVVYISTLIVKEEKRNHGIGKKLMEQVEKLARQFNAHKIFLFTMAEWSTSQFYESLGYEKTGDLRKHFLGKDFIIYSKFI